MRPRRDRIVCGALDPLRSQPGSKFRTAAVSCRSAVWYPWLEAPDPRRALS